MRAEANNIPPTIESRPMERPNSSRVFLLLGMIAGITLAGLFYFFDPVQHRFFPLCVFHQVTGLNCPGCGGQRALHYLLHGEIWAALRCNALVLVALPAAVWMVARWCAARFSNRELPQLFNHHGWAWVLGGMIILFGVLRNLPGFAWLSP